VKSFLYLLRAALPSALALLLAASSAPAASPPGDVVGKITVGYQGWFACIGDGSPIHSWWHWSPDSSRPPSPANNDIQFWPDLREYTHLYPTAYANLGNGQPAALFSSYDQQTVDRQFLWMQQNGCDTAALQRFNPDSPEGPNRDAMLAAILQAAPATGRKFYIMYDVSGWTNMQSEIKTDWIGVIQKTFHATDSPAYAHQNGKPVVCIWGFGFNDRNHRFSPAACLDVIKWFHAQGCYVIGGVPTWWREGKSDSRPGFLGVYTAFDMLSPWMVGRIGTIQDSDNYLKNTNLGDQAYCNAHSIDYQPCVLPGGGVTTQSPLGQRIHGDLMWHEFYNMVHLGCQAIYISMFDEYGEGNQIAKTAEDASMTPVNAGPRMYTLDQDGTRCSSDYYLRLTADGGKMLKGQIPLTATRPTPPECVRFYSLAGYSGAASDSLVPGNYTQPQLTALGLSTTTDSLQIPSGWSATIYSSDHFTGPSQTLTADIPKTSLSISSLQITAPPTP
jgi:hypothetical protein